MRSDEDEVIEISMPAIRSARTKANDQVYRQMEAASEHRAEKAAEALGVPVSEMSDMKITNLNDRRDAEVAVVPVNNAVTQQMEVLNARGGQFGFTSPDAAGFKEGVKQGPYPNAGAKTVSTVQRLMGRG